jgi:hypothetical protein
MFVLTKMKKQLSLLENETLTALLETAKKNLEKYPELQPVIFAKLEGETKPAVLPVEFPNSDHNEKAFRLFAYGEALRRATGKKITEAVFISDTYFLAQPKDEAPASLPVRENPLRREAIMLVGRDNSGDKRVLLLQAYTRTDNKIIFDKTPELDTKAGSATGLLDYFFSANEGRLSDLAGDIMQQKQKTKYGKN